MEYKILKFAFTTGVHFGKRTLDDTEFALGADTIFSALCQEYLKQGEQELKSFVEKAAAGAIRISDALPYIGDTFYLPKPMLRIETEQKDGDSGIKKAYKKLSYVPAQKLQQYLDGTLDVKQESDRFKKGLGNKVIKVSAAVRGEEETLPYRVGAYYFKPQSGLYLILGYERNEDAIEVEDSLSALGLSGIGGKRTAGLGRFELKYGTFSEDMIKRLKSEHGSVYMSLSLSLPALEELEEALQEARYLLVKRSGFVMSENYATEQSRKRDLYVFQSGACFHRKFEGDIYDVGDRGAHPVYRYAKPLFLEVRS